MSVKQCRLSFWLYFVEQNTLEPLFLFSKVVYKEPTQPVRYTLYITANSPQKRAEWIEAIRSGLSFLSIPFAEGGLLPGRNYGVM